MDHAKTFLETCQSGPVAELTETQQLLNNLRDFSLKEAQIPPLPQLKRSDLLGLIITFNDLRVDSEKLTKIKQKLLDQLKLENDLFECVKSKFTLMDEGLQISGDLGDIDWVNLQPTFQNPKPSFRSIAEEMLFYFERLDQIENELLKANFLKFVNVYMGFLDRIHQKINKVTSEEEARELEEEIGRTLRDCPVVVKKAKELREISKNTKHLQNIIQRIEEFYNLYDQNKESLKILAEQKEVDIRQIEQYEQEFTKIYEKGVMMEQNQKMGSLNQMKKSIESYLSLRKKEKELSGLRGLNRKEGGSQKDQCLTKESENLGLGKRDSPQKENNHNNVIQSNLKKVKTFQEEGQLQNGEQGTPKKELISNIKIKEEKRREEEEVENEGQSLDSLEKSELSDADSDCSNEFILKKRQKIRKLKSLIIRKKEEQNDLVNQSDEKTSSFLHKKFSLMLLFFKLRVLGLDPETCSKTDSYLNTVKETDEMMKKTSLGKVTISELKQLIVKCEEMKYFSQGYQKFKRLRTLFKAFKNHTENLRMQFRGGLKITQEVKTNFMTQANLKSYRASVNNSGNGQHSIVLTRRQHSLFTKNSKKDWRSLNNKRKTKLRLGTDSFSSDSKSQKKKVKEKIINAIYGKNQKEYCLCREPYELTSMIQFTNCSEWFHKECIKIPKYQMKRIKTKNCPACFFLHESKTDKFPHFRKRKIPFDQFLSILKTAKVLSHFILDERIDEIFYIQTKLYRLERDLSHIKLDFINKIDNEQSITVLWTQLHAVASLYIYLPVKNDLIEETLLFISKAVLKQLNNGHPQGSMDMKNLKFHSKKSIDKPRSKSKCSVPSQRTSVDIQIETQENTLQIQQEQVLNSREGVPHLSDIDNKETRNGTRKSIENKLDDTPLQNNIPHPKIQENNQNLSQEKQIKEEQTGKVGEPIQLEANQGNNQNEPEIQKPKTE